MQRKCDGLMRWYIDHRLLNWDEWIVWLILGWSSDPMVVDGWVVHTENIFEVLQCSGRLRVALAGYMLREWLILGGWVSGTISFHEWRSSLADFQRKVSKKIYTRTYYTTKEDRMCCLTKSNQSKIWLLWNSSDILRMMI